MEPTTVATGAGFRLDRWLRDHFYAGRIDDWMPMILAIEAEARAAAVAPLEKAGQAMYDAIRPFWESVQQPTTSHEGGTLIEASSPVEHTPESALIAAMKAWDRALLSALPLRPSGEPEPGGLRVKPSSFGDWIDLGPLNGDSIIVAVNDGGGLQPVLWVKLPHQLYVADVEKLYAEHREVWVLPIRSSEWIAVPRILAATPKRPAGEAV